MDERYAAERRREAQTARARERISIRRRADEARVAGQQAERAELASLVLDELLILAVCNLAEALDSRP